MIRVAFCVLFGAVSAAGADLAVEVIDPSGRIVAGATVSGRDVSGKEIAKGVTSSEGIARIPGGIHTVEVRADGFRVSDFAVGGRSEITVRLALGAVNEVIGVRAELRSEQAVAAEMVRPDPVPRTDLVESLKGSPHVHVLRRGGVNFEPVVQGLRETQIAMVVDGTRTLAAGPARMDSELSHVAPGAVDTVEVVTGPYALTEGAGAMAAIVAKSTSIPRHPDSRFGGRGGIGWRSNGAGRTAHARIDAGNSAIGISLQAGGNLLNDYRAGFAGSAGRPLVPSDAAAHQFGAKMRFSPSASQELDVAGVYDEQTGVDYPGRLLTAEHFLLRGWRASYRLARADRAIAAVKLQAYANGKSYRMSNRGKPTAMDMPGRMPPFALDVSLPAESDTVGGSGRVEIAPGEGTRLYAGFDHFRLEQDAQRFISRARDRALLFSDAVWAGTSLTDTGLYLLAARASDRGELRAAGRIDLVGSDAGRPSAFFLDNSPGDLERRETNASYSVSGRYELLGGLTLAGGAGRVVRTANALERYSDRFPSTRFQVAAEFMGDPGIRPESSTQGDLNVDWQAGEFRFSAGGYVRSLGNYITVSPDPDVKKLLPLSPPVVFRYVNGTGAFFRGWSLGIRRSGRHLEFRAHANKTMADDRELMEPVLGIAPMEFDSTVRHVSPAGRFWAEYGVRSLGTSDECRQRATRRHRPVSPCTGSVRVSGSLTAGPRYTPASRT